jgi:hypothetical protein
MQYPTGRMLEYDVSKRLLSTVIYWLQMKIFIPELSLAFEYNGESHYTSIPMYLDLSVRQQKDQQKKIISREVGITLIEVPFWWQRNEASLIATLRSIRPDIPLPASDAKPIPLNMPSALAHRFPSSILMRKDIVSLLLSDAVSKH